MSTRNEGHMGTASRIVNFISETPEVPLMILLIAFYMFIANYFAWSSALAGNMLNFSGGSDPYWNYHMIQYILTHKQMLTFSPLLNYPLGTWNPRNGTFHWLIVFAAYLVSPFYNVYNAATFGLLEIDAVFGALLIIPVYLISNEVFGKKSAMLAAILYTLMPSNFTSGILTDARTEHTPILFFALFTIYFFMRTMHYIGKERIVTSISDVRSYPKSILTFIRNNRLGTIYSFFTAGTLGSLMVAWQGFAYIEAILAIYVMVQLVFNLVTRRPTGYMTFVSVILFGFSLLMGYYYYFALHELSPWWTSAFYIAVIAIGFSIITNITGRRPWIITLPLIVILSGVGLLVLNIVDPSAVANILAGDGYFIKTRVYQTIAEASTPALGTYISGFGAVQFLLGMAGVVYTVYLFLKKRNDLLLVFLVFSLVSIYMSFAAARFNITAGPAYAAMGGATLAYFARLMKVSDLKHRTPTEASGIRKAVRGNISLGKTIFVIFVVLGVITSGFGVVNAAIPGNTATTVNQQIYKSLPSFVKPLINYSASNDQFVGTYSFYITNASQSEPMAFNWLSQQDTNLPIDQRPAFVSWWDYGFQELVQGQHPAVADDFQQGYEVGGQTLLAQNQSQILSLWIGRVLQGAFKDNGQNLSSSVVNSMQKYLGTNETVFLENVLGNAGQYTYLIQQNPATYGKYISDLSGQNALFILFTGSLSSQYSLSTLINLYQVLEAETGYNIQYIYMDQGLLPQSGINPGIFYAPTYLTDHPSYTYQGEIVPYQYYQIYSETANGTQNPLNQTTSLSQVVNYTIGFTQAFYNTSIYRFLVGYPPWLLGSTNGIPGLTVNTTANVMPDWNLSNFELTYAGVPWNPYTDYQNHSQAWKIIPISTAYVYKHENKGTTILLPALSTVISGWDTISAYYPGAVIQGHVTLADGTPAAGVYVTILDQYGIPHEMVKTNSNGYYNLTGLPGNDSVYISTGLIHEPYLVGSNLLGYYTVNISKEQAERLVPAYSIGGVSGYNITKNYVISTGSLKGSVTLEIANPGSSTSSISAGNGTLLFQGTLSNRNYTVAVKGGQYSLPNAVPGTYNVSFITDNGTLSNFTEENVTVSAENLQIGIPADTLFVNVSAGQKRLSGIRVYANSENYSTSALTNSSGVATLAIGTGNYTVFAEGSGFTTLHRSVNFSQWNLNTSISVNLVPAVNISGTISGSSSATIVFMRNGVYNNNSTVNAINGKFSAVVPVGYYTVYATSGSLVAVTSRDFTVSSNISLVLSRGNYVNVSAVSSTSVLESGYFEAMSTTGLLLASPVSSQSYFNFLLPSGIYGFATTFKSPGLTYAGFKSYQILGNLSFSITTDYAGAQNPLSVSLKTSTSTSVQDGVLVEKQSGVPVYYQPLSGGGSITLMHPVGNSTLYTVYFMGPGYGNASGTALGSSKELSMTVSAEFSQFTLNLKSSTSIPASGTLYLTGTENYQFSFSNNIVNGTVIPGVYYLSVSPTEGSINLSTQIFVVPYSLNYVTYGQFNQYFSLTTTSPYLAVFNTNGVQVNPSSLLPGTYTVYSYSARESNISTVHVAGDVNLTPTLEPSLILSLENSEGLSGGTYKVSTGGNVLSTLYDQILLPYGTYSVSYSKNYTVSGIDYSAIGNSSVSLYSYSSVNVPLTIKSVSTQLSGVVTYDGVTMPSAQVKVYNSNGTQILNLTTDKNGNFSAQVWGGNYTLYSYFKGYSIANVSSVYVPAFSASVVHNISLISAYSTYVSETRLGKVLNRNVSITNGSSKILFNTSLQNILLPSGFFAFTGSVQYSQQNFTGGNMTVYWNNSISVNINQTSYVNVILSRVSIYSFSSGMLTNVSTVSEGANLTDQVFYLKNTGNSYVNLTFSSGLANLTIQVNQSKVELAPGQNVSLSANLVLPEDLPAGTNSLPIIASYQSANYTIYVKTNITTTTGLSESVNPMSNYVEGNGYVVLVNITNTGNTKLKLNVSMNTSEASNFGWTVNISSKNINYTTFSIAAFQSATVYVNITPNAQNSFSSGILHLKLTPSIGNATNYSLHVSFPNQATVSSSPSGTGITQMSGNPYLTLITGIVIIVAAVIAGLFGATYRGRKNK